MVSFHKCHLARSGWNPSDYVKWETHANRSNPPEGVDVSVETRSAFSDFEFAGDAVLRTVPVWLIGSEVQSIQVNASLGDGSDSTHVQDNIVTALGLKTD